MVRFSWNFIYIAWGTGEEHIWNFFAESNVVSEIWVMFIWSSQANTGTKLAKIRLKIINTLTEWIWSWSYLPMVILHRGTGKYLMNWIQVVYFKLKEIWPLFSPAKAKKPSSFFTSLPPKHESMKPNLSQKVRKLVPNDDCFTEELVGILSIEFKLFISNWKRFDCYFPLLKPKKGFVFFWTKSNLSQNLALKLAYNENYFTEELLGISWMEFKFFTSNWKRFDLYFPLFPQW